MFYRLLSWKNPRATGIAFGATILFIFAARYLNIFRYALKFLWVTLGVTTAAEVAGQLAFGRGLTSQFRPRQYYTVPKASLERMLDDCEQLINFCVIESQRIVFAENVYATGAVSKLYFRLDVHANRIGLLRFPHLIRSHQDRSSLGLDLDRHPRYLPHSSHLHPEQGGHRCSAREGSTDRQPAGYPDQGSR